MIFDGLLDWVQSGVTYVIGLLPTMSVDCSAAADAGSYLSWVGGFVDLGALGAVLGTMLAIEFGVWGVAFVIKLWQQLKW